MEKNKNNELLEAARKAALGAYAPYSNFRVGAAVQTEKGIFLGANIENASYGLTVCAERTAFFHAKLHGATKITALAVACIDACPESGDAEKMPCGACRQVAQEFMDPTATVIVDGLSQPLQLSDLLPKPFRLGSR